MAEEERRRKGKMLMSEEQLEEEQKKKDEQNEKEMMEKVNNTPLTQIIQQILPKHLTKQNLPQQFSWGEPSSSGIRLWEKGETSNKSRSSESIHSNIPTQKNPLPIPLNQTYKPFCIPYALTHLLRLQSNIISTFKKQPTLLISLHYLIDMFLTLRRRGSKNITELTDKLITKGLSDVANYRYPPKTVLTNLSLTWYYGFSAVGRSETEIGHMIANSVLFYGGVLVEYYELDDYGKIQDDLSGKPLAHVVMCYGWKVVDGKYELHCLDSAKVNADSCFGFVVFRNLPAIYHVYAIQLDD